MAARSTSRFKRKPAVPFGDFMLPILGVIALGIVVMGIRMLWAPSAPKSAIVPQPRVTQTKKTPASAVPKEESSYAQAVSDSAVATPKSSAAKNAVTPALSAGPVYDDKTASAKTASAKSTVSAPASAPAQTSKAQPKPQSAQTKTTVTVKPAQPKTNTTQPKASAAKSAAPVKSASVDKSQFIVQCGSFTDRAGAEMAVKKLKNLGYSPVIRKADVRGKSYFRVVVGGGSRNQAEAVEADIKQKTPFPTLVRSNTGN